MGHSTENILIYYISHDIFRKTHKLDHSSGIATTVEYMVLDVSNIGGIQDIKIGKANIPQLREAYFAYIKKNSNKKEIISRVSTMTNTANFVADYIGRNLIWIDI